MARQVSQIEFKPAEAGAVIEAMARIETAGDGWMNLFPGVPEDQAPVPATGLNAILGPKNPGAVMATWAPPTRGRRGLQAGSVGILHSAGRFAARQLAAIGVPVPEGWPIRQDNPRRGLITQVPIGTPVADVLQWMIAASTALFAFDMTGSWRADFYLPAA